MIKIKKIFSAILTLTLLFTFLGNLSLAAAADQEVKTVMSEKTAPLPGAENLIANGSFETLNEGIPSGWSSFGNSWDSYVKVNTDPAHARTGNNSIKISTDKQNMPWTRVFVSNVVPGAEYQFSAWIQTIQMAGSTGFKFEYYSGNEVAAEAALGGITPTRTNYITGDGSWMELVGRIKAPEKCVGIAFYLRMFDVGEAYYDDVECYMVTPPDPISHYDTDWVFYYSEWETGEATATVNIGFYPELIGAPVNFTLKDGDNVLKAVTANVDSMGKAGFKYDLSLLAEKQKEYIVECTLTDKSGKALDAKSSGIYKYDRPKYLRADGVYEKDGKVIDPIFGYHIVKKPELPRAAEGGINVMQGSATKEWLDWAQENGVMILGVLYWDGKSAGHPDRIEDTIKKVTELKDHPALFGWMLMDEPFGSNLPEDVVPQLINGYKTIRGIDPNHPVYAVDSSKFREVGKYVDIVAADSYPAGMVPATVSISETLKTAQEELEYKKPVYSLLQTFLWKDYFPTSDELRSMIYQSLFDYAPVGYFCFSDSLDANTPLDSTEVWPAIKSFAQLEAKDAYAHFTHGEFPTFNEVRGNDVWWESWVKNDEIYMVVLNRSDKNNTAVEIPLTNFDGSIRVNGFTATVINGAEAANFTGNGTLSLNLAPAQTTLYKITPDEKIDFSGIKESRFKDLGYYPWARVQIDALDRFGIVNSMSPISYAPQKNITRADFAMFLIRTLGLTGNYEENFDDVDQSAYYAKEIAVGKALGILHGMEDGKFYPEAFISRQDMMTICARGMRVASKLGENGSAEDLAVFSDSSIIADYALNSIAAMVRDGIIKGNADGTINPFGNTTRAEAAVIMYRILTKN